MPPRPARRISRSGRSSASDCKCRTESQLKHHVKHQPEVIMLRRTISIVALFAVSLSTGIHAQGLSGPSLQVPEVHRSGPRYGVIWLSPGLTDSVSTHFKNQKINPTTSLFGWEFQRELLQNPNGMVPVSSLVVGVAGLDQGLLLPSGSWLIGM